MKKKKRKKSTINVNARKVLTRVVGWWTLCAKSSRKWLSWQRTPTLSENQYNRRMRRGDFSFTGPANIQLKQLQWLLDPRSGQLIHKILTKLISRISLNSALGHFEHSKGWCTAGQRLDVRFAVFFCKEERKNIDLKKTLPKAKRAQGLNSILTKPCLLLSWI